MQFTEKQIARYWARIKFPEAIGTDECWESQHHTNYVGYPQVTINYRQILTHRLSWELANGPIPAGMLVCHSCDNRRCANPAHLWLGTHKDNMHDMQRKGRKVILYGDDAKHRKLTSSQVAEIRQRHQAGGITMKALADEYGVTRTNISYIIAGKLWQHK